MGARVLSAHFAFCTGVATGTNAKLGFESRMLEHTAHDSSVVLRQFRENELEVSPGSLTLFMVLVMLLLLISCSASL